MTSRPSSAGTKPSRVTFTWWTPRGTGVRKSGAFPIRMPSTKTAASEGWVAISSPGGGGSAATRSRERRARVVMASATNAATATTTPRRPGHFLADQREACLRSTVSAVASSRGADAPPLATTVSATDTAGALGARAATKSPALEKRAEGSFARARRKTLS